MTGPAAQVAAPVPLLRRLLAAAQAGSRQWVQQLHPGWVEAAWAGGAARWQVPQPGPAGTRISLQLARVYGVRWPDLSALRPRAHRLVVLPRPQALQVLAAAALYPRRAALRRCVGRTARQALVALLGEPAYAGLLDTADGPGTQALPDIGAPDLETWAALGYDAWHAAGGFSCRQVSLITRLMLAPDALDSVARPPGPAAELDSFAARLDTFFPEQSWLFGSDMDLALSGSTTGSSAPPTSPH